MDRVILHCDCNSFYASVELLARPDLRDLPVAVGGSAENRHGIILAKNEAAKKFGVKTAETLREARRKCPELIILPPHRDRYIHYSKKLNAIYYRYTDLVEPFGIDESWLDITHSMHLFGTAHEVADRIRTDVRGELGLTVSVGISFCKVLAKLGSDYQKPDATTELTRENFRALIGPLPVTDMLFVGRATAAALATCRIRTIAELAAADRAALSRALGKMGETIHDYANGIDDSPVGAYGHERDPKSVGNGVTFRRDLTTRREMSTAATALCDEVAGRLRRYGHRCGTVTVQLKDKNLRTVSRQKKLAEVTDLAREMRAAAMQLIDANWQEGSPVRAMTITAGSLTADEELQTIWLLEPADREREKHQRVESAIDEVRRRFGPGAVNFGSTVHSDIGLEDDMEPQ